MLLELAQHIKARRVALGWAQVEAAQRAGVACRTWRRLQTEGQASLQDLVKAAVALRCEDGLKALLPPPAASSLHALLAEQAAGAASGAGAGAGSPVKRAQVAAAMKLAPGTPLAASLTFEGLHGFL
ncbi:hypothetical protein M9M90_05010 [Phenylobacterium sp. LH3H17]|uniref:hypothetical protein n=1 Tax=Phenylobacterium sp. LH3H17 TaxID=2903901 RepID=UPI0020C9DBF5|nr:hypothetical protein [Phenylobacterium sp. LH3H17]UTP40547.1 hypothetical protein M9M90_05010 [Phenylobacterium sp. LH3H17]